MDFHLGQEKALEKKAAMLYDSTLMDDKNAQSGR
jgi:hypothetical protein